MPTLKWSRAILTLATDTPIQTLAWMFQYLPWPAACKVGQKTTAIGVTEAIFSGSQTIQETSVIQVVATAGVTPSELNTAFTYWKAAAGDFLKILNTNTTGGTLTVDGIIVVEPAY
jgi:hypothetical protein